MPDDILTRARVLLDGITPGVWKLETDPEPPHVKYAVIGNFMAGGCILATADPFRKGPTDEDIIFVAAAPDLVRELCAEVERLRAVAGGGDGGREG